MEGSPECRGGSTTESSQLDPTEGPLLSREFSGLQDLSWMGLWGASGPTPHLAGGETEARAEE